LTQGFRAAAEWGGTPGNKAKQNENKVKARGLRHQPAVCPGEVTQRADSSSSSSSHMHACAYIDLFGVKESWPNGWISIVTLPAGAEASPSYKSEQ